MLKQNCLCAVACLVFMAGRGFGAYPLATDDAGLVTKGGYEVEAGFDNCKDENDLTIKTCGVSFKHGVTDNMDIGFSFPYRVEPAVEEHAGEATAGVKFSLIDDMLAVSFTNELGEKDYFINAVCTQSLSALKLSANAGYLSTGDETIRGLGSYGIAVELPVKKFDIVAEVQGVEGGTGSGLVGLRLHITEPFFIAGAVSKDFQTSADKVTVGFHVEF